MSRRFLSLMALTSSWLLIAQLTVRPPLHAQCTDPQPANSCVDAPLICDLDDLCFSLTPEQTFNGPTPMCDAGGGGVPNNPRWLAFYAPCTELFLNVIPTNCSPVGGTNGIQTAIYRYAGDGVCTNTTATPPEFVACSGDCPGVNPSQLLATNLEPGELYYLVVDGCAGSICDVEIDVLGNPFCLTPLDPNSAAILGPDTLCRYATGSFRITPEVHRPGLRWSVNGALASLDQVPVLSWDSAGVYTVCVRQVHPCLADTLAQICKTLVVREGAEVQVSLPPVVVCPDSTFLFEGASYTAGMHEIRHPLPNGCDSVVTLIVEEDPVVEDLGKVAICLGDFFVVGSDTVSTNGSYEIAVPDLHPPLCDSFVHFDLQVLKVTGRITGDTLLNPLDPILYFNGAGSFAAYNGSGSFFWYRLGGPSLDPPVSEPFVAITDTGTYCLVYSREESMTGVSCSDTVCRTVIWDPTVAVTEPNLTSTGWRAFPVPTRAGITFVRDPQHTTPPRDLWLSALDGREMQRLRWPEQADQIHLPGTDLPAGIYLWGVTDQNGRRQALGRVVVLP